MFQRLRNGSFVLILTALMLWPAIAQAEGPIMIGVNGEGQRSRDANIGWVRTGPYWKDVHTGFNQYNFSEVDRINDAAYARGQNVLMILSGAPYWCSGRTNGNTPCSLDYWRAYVDALTRHMYQRRLQGRGGVAAYEIWNEPDSINQSAFGVGWDWWDLDTYPHRYIDYFMAAAAIIRANDPTALIAGPAMKSSKTRAVTIWQQFENNYLPDGRNASELLDVVTFHHNGAEWEHSETIAINIKDRIENIIRRWNFRNYRKPVWVTEFGWRADEISDNSQRIRIKNVLIEMGGGGYGYLRGYNVQKAFIYRLGGGPGCDGDSGWDIFYCPSGFPRPVTYQYLQTLPFPATQVPWVPRE